MTTPERRRRLLSVLARAERHHQPLSIRAMKSATGLSTTSLYLALMDLRNDGLVTHNPGKHGATWRANLPLIVEQKEEQP